MKHCLTYLLFLYSFIVPGQEKAECKQKVVAAENQFKQGLYSQSEVTIRQVLDNCHLSRKNRMDAYEILTRINIETDNLDEAYKNLKKVIKLNPNYQPNSARVEEDYLKYFSKYKVVPVLSAGLYAEILFPTYINSGEPNVILNDYDYSAGYSATGLNSLAGMNITLGFPSNTRVSVSPGFMSLSYTRQIKHRDIANFSTTLNETDRSFCIPIEINQHKKFKRFTFFAGLGYTHCILNSASATIISKYPKLEYDTTNYVDLIQKGNIFFTEYSSANMKPLRRNLDFYKLNLGATYNISNFIIDLKLSYNRALTLMNSENYYLPQNVIFKNYYMDNSFYCNYMSVNLSLSYILAYKINHKK